MQHLQKTGGWGQSGSIFHLTVHSTLPPILRTLFQVPYAATPLFATLTKTPGVWGYYSHSGNPRASSTFRLSDFQALLSLIGRRLRTGLGVSPYAFLSTFNCRLSTSAVPLFSNSHICYSGGPKMKASPLLLPQSATRKRKPTP